MSHRDLVNFEPNERVDLPDFLALQRGNRAESRAQMRTLLFASDLKKILGGFEVTASGTPDAIIHVANGRGVAAFAHDDNTYEYGVMFGVEGETEINVDFTGRPNATYGVFVRFNTPEAQLGNRLFYNGTAESEEVAAIDTRLAAEWDVTVSTSAPTVDYIQIATVVWGGATIATGNIASFRDMFFEGHQFGSYAHVWGDAANDRNVDRAKYGVTNLYQWVHAIRRQIEEIVGDSQKWYENFTRIYAGKFAITGFSTTNMWDATDLKHSAGSAGRVQFVGDGAVGDGRMIIDFGDEPAEHYGDGGIAFYDAPADVVYVEYKRRYYSYTAFDLLTGARADQTDDPTAGVNVTNSTTPYLFTYDTGAPGATHNIKMPLHLPHGERLDDAGSVTTNVNVVGADITINTYFVRTLKASPWTRTLVGCGDLASPAPGAYEIGTLYAPNNVIDNSLYTYSYEVIFNNGTGASGSIQIYSVGIRTITNKATPDGLGTPNGDGDYPP